MLKIKTIRSLVVGSSAHSRSAYEPSSLDTWKRLRAFNLDKYNTLSKRALRTLKMVFEYIPEEEEVEKMVRQPP